MSALELSAADTEEILLRGELEVMGRLQWSSNGAALVVARAGGVEVLAVYKPRRGERPLWDFPDGTLCQREVAAYAVSVALGWDLVPVTVLREEAPFGPGALQRFVEHDPDDHYFTLRDDHRDRFRQFAAFDVVVNNTDRKGGHLLLDREAGVVVGIDHGLTFHAAWKLRTVVWDFAGEPVPPELADDVCRLVRAIESGEPDLGLDELLSPVERRALAQRAGALLHDGTFPEPDLGYRSVPWPLV